MIPRRIFQTWKKFGDWPVSSWPAIPIEEQVDSWKEMNRGFEYSFFTDEDCFDFVNTEYPELKDLYERIAVVKRADLWRYLVLHRYGGFYADIDCICARPLTPIIGHPETCFVAGVENDLGHCRYKDGSYTNWAIGSAPGHPILKTMIEMLTATLRSQGPTTHLDFQAWRANVLESTGPILWTEAVRKHMGLPGVSLGPLPWFARGWSIIDAVIDSKVPPEEQLAFWHNRVAEIRREEPDVFVLHTYYGTWRNDDRDKA